MKLFKLIKKSKRIAVIMASGLMTMTALAATTVSTLAWFSHMNAPITGVVDSGNTSLTNVTAKGYKFERTNENDLSEGAVHEIDLSNQNSVNKSEGLADTYKGPSAGVGYYIVGTGTIEWMKYENSAWTVASTVVLDGTMVNAVKMITWTGDVLAKAENIRISEDASLSFVFHDMDNAQHVTDTEVNISYVSGSSKAILNNQTGTVDFNAQYVFTLDLKVSNENRFVYLTENDEASLASVEKSNGRGIKVSAPKKSTSFAKPKTIYLNFASVSWWKNDDIMYLHYWKDGGTDTCVKMAMADGKAVSSTSSTYAYCILPAGDWDYVQFARISDGGVWNNQTTNQSASNLTDNNCFELSGGKDGNNHTGSWKKAGAVLMNSSRKIWLWNSGGDFTGGNWGSRPNLLGTSNGSGYIYVWSGSSEPTSVKFDDGGDDLSYSSSSPFYNSIKSPGVISNLGNLLYLYNVTTGTKSYFSWDPSSRAFTLTTGILPSGTQFYFQGETFRTDKKTGGAISGTTCASEGSNYVVSNKGKFEFIITAEAYATYGNYSYGIYSSFTNYYDVSFNENGHGSAPSSQTIVSGGKVSLPLEPTATGYTFGGWYKESGCSNAWDFASDTVSEDITLYAKWTGLSYKVAFNANGGSNAMETMQPLTYGAGGTITANSFERSGYTFIGWKIENAGDLIADGASLSLIVPTSNNQTITLYAQWQQRYRILYDKGDGSGTQVTQTVELGHNATAKAENTFTRTGYTFAYWSKSLGGSKAYDPDDTISEWSSNTADTTPVPVLYAVWTPIKYSVNIAAGTGVSGVWVSSASDGTGLSASGTKFDFESTIYGYIQLSAGYEAPDGWAVQGNYYKKALTVSNANDSSNTFGTVSANLIIYTIGYTMNGGTSSPENPTSYNVTTTTFTLTNPTKTGHTFTGWSGTSLDGNANLTVTIAKGSTGKRNYTANFSINSYSVSATGRAGISSVYFSTSNTATSGAGTSFNYGETVYCYVQKKPGWTAPNTWSLVEGTTDKYLVANYVLQASNYDFGTIDATTTEYTITYNSNGGSAIVATSYTMVYADTTKSLSTPTRTGYTFNGWEVSSGPTYGSPTVTNKTTLAILADMYGNITVTASWTINGYAITAAPESASYGSVTITNNDTSQTVSSGSNVDHFTSITISAASNYGYKFEGWYVGGVRQDDLDSSFTTTVSRALTYTAKYTAIYYVYTGDEVIGDGQPTAYAWDTSNNNEDSATGHFPGTQMSKVGRNTYSIQLSTKYNYIIFSINDNSHQTDNLPTANKGGKIFNLKVRTGTKWYDTAIVTYEPNGADSGSSYSEVFSIDIVTNIVPDASLHGFEKAGQKVIGWATTSGGEASYDDEGELTSLSGGDIITLFAKWGQPYFTVVFNANTQSNTNYSLVNLPTGSTASVTNVLKGDLCDLTTNGFFLDYYTFTGWSLSADAAVASYTNGQTDVEFTRAQGGYSGGTVTLYAIWEPIAYNIVYSLDDGSASNPESYTFETTSFTLNNPTKTGYSFTGWSGTGLSGEDNVSVTIAANSYGNRSYTAHWEIGRYTVTLNKDGVSSTGESEITATYNAAMPSLLVIPFLDNYIFQGYYTGTNGSGTQYYNASGESTHNYDNAGTLTTLYACWKVRIFICKASNLTDDKTGWGDKPGLAYSTLANPSSNTDGFTFIYGDPIYYYFQKDSFIWFSTEIPKNWTKLYIFGQNRPYNGGATQTRWFSNSEPELSSYNCIRVLDPCSNKDKNRDTAWGGYLTRHTKVADSDFCPTQDQIYLRVSTKNYGYFDTDVMATTNLTNPSNVCEKEQIAFSQGTQFLVTRVYTTNDTGSMPYAISIDLFPEVAGNYQSSYKILGREYPYANNTSGNNNNVYVLSSGTYSIYVNSAGRIYLYRLEMRLHIYTDGTWTGHDVNMGSGDTHNHYLAISEQGIYLKAGDCIAISEFSEKTLSSYGFSNVSSDALTQNLIANAGSTLYESVASIQILRSGRYNIFLTNEETRHIEIQDIPDEGFGYYIATGSSYDYKGSAKMAEPSSGSYIASYINYYVASGSTIKIRSFDYNQTVYTTLYDSYAFASISNGIITFSQTNSYNIRIDSVGKITIEQSTGFHTLNSIASTSATHSLVQGENTALVYAISFKASSTKDMKIQITLADNSANSIVKYLRCKISTIDASVGESLINNYGTKAPYYYMRNQYGAENTWTKVAQSTDTVLSVLSTNQMSFNSADTHQIFVLIDYDPGQVTNLGSLNAAARFNIEIAIVQA